MFFYAEPMLELWQDEPDTTQLLSTETVDGSVL